MFIKLKKKYWSSWSAKAMNLNSRFFVWDDFVEKTGTERLKSSMNNDGDKIKIILLKYYISQ